MKSVTEKQVIDAMQILKTYCNEISCKDCIISDYCVYVSFGDRPLCDIDIEELRANIKEDSSNA